LNLFQKFIIYFRKKKEFHNKRARKMILRNKRALSPVISGIILIAVTVAVAIAATTWLGSMTFSFMSTEEIQLTSCQWAEDASYADLTVKNFGTSMVTLQSAQVSNIEASSVSFIVAANLLISFRAFS